MGIHAGAAAPGGPSPRSTPVRESSEDTRERTQTMESRVCGAICLVYRRYRPPSMSLTWERVQVREQVEGVGRPAPAVAEQRRAEASSKVRRQLLRSGCHGKRRKLAPCHVLKDSSDRPIRFGRIVDLSVAGVEQRRGEQFRDGA
jgi:hypothetical protein